MYMIYCMYLVLQYYIVISVNFTKQLHNAYFSNIKIAC